jgi:hypothetical protein
VRRGLAEVAAFTPPPAPPAREQPFPARRSAHAEAAALRWREHHPCAPD